MHPLPGLAHPQSFSLPALLLMQGKTQAGRATLTKRCSLGSEKLIALQGVVEDLGACVDLQEGSCQVHNSQHHHLPPRSQGFDLQSPQSSCQLPELPQAYFPALPKPWGHGNRRLKRSPWWRKTDPDGAGEYAGRQRWSWHQKGPLSHSAPVKKIKKKKFSFICNLGCRACT